MLENLSERLQGIFSGLRSKGRLTEDDINAAMREIRLALLEADVNFKVVKNFVARTKERCLSAEVLDSLTPAQNVVKIVLDELTELLGRTDSRLVLSSRIPNVIMLVGLQGSGKTTAAAKLAYRLKQENHSPLLIAGDVYRPAAADQLQTLGDEIGVRVYRGDGRDPVAIAREGIQDAIDNLRDVVIIDTAGRLHVDADMMEEAQAIKDATHPDQILMVVDAMTGQDVVNVVEAFAESVDFDGVIMSKMDGDARGGGALSIREVTGKPIKFISSGEKPDSLEVFHPDRIAGRILGMGDVLTLVEKAQSTINAEEAEELARKMQKASFDLEDFRTQMRRIKKLGSLDSILKMIPGLGGLREKLAEASGAMPEKELARTEAIINSMTMRERRNPDILNGSRRARIAKGAGVTVAQVNQTVRQFEQMRQMMKGMMGGKGGRPAMPRIPRGMPPGMMPPGMGMPGMGGFPGMPGMDSMELPGGRPSGGKSAAAKKRKKKERQKRKKK